MLFHFGDHVLDLPRRELRCGGKLVVLEPQVFDLIAFLLRNRDRVVSKSALIEDVWRGRSVSDATIHSRIKAARQAIGDSGAEQALIRTLPRKGVRFVGDAHEEDTAAQSPDPIISDVAGQDAPARPSIAIFPFSNMSGDPEQEYFADGMVEDITTALSRIRSLFVIARNSAFAYKGKSPDVRQVGRDLGVRYVLEGSVRKAGNRVRITGQLIDTTTGAHIWSDRFDGDLTDVFDLQDRVTSSVAGAIEPQLQRAEIERAQRKATQDLGAYDYFLRGMAIFHEVKIARMREALALFVEAFTRDANFGAAHAMAANCILRLKADGYLDASAPEPAEGLRLARLASVTGKDDATALAIAGSALAFFAKDIEAGALLTQRACEMNPNSALAWNLAAWNMVWLGDPAAAIESFERAMRLSPLDPLNVASLAGMAQAHLVAGRYHEATECAARAVSDQPNASYAHRIHAATLALAGRLEEARRAMDEMRRLSPRMRLSEARDWMMPFRRPEDTARYTEGLRLAGMPQ